MRALKLMRKALELLPAAVFLLLAAGTPQSLAAKYTPEADEEWITYKNPRYGYSFYYPSALFEDGNVTDDGGGVSFASNDGQARAVVFGASNDEKLSITEYRRTLLEDFGGYEQLDYQPQGQTWFVLSGIRGDNTYYQKVMFSCSNRIINVLSVTFPTAEKDRYERLIEIMEDRFRPAQGADAPEGC